jgi:hypothetical protein
VVLAIAGCAGQSTGMGTAGPTPCGGSHEWPPNGYAAAPAGLTVERLSATSARLANATGADWSFAATAWFDGGCTGWMAAQPDVRGSLPARGSADVTVAGAGAGQPYRIGIQFWDHPCDAACTDPPTGFTWVPGTDAPETAAP